MSTFLWLTAHQDNQNMAMSCQNISMSFWHGTLLRQELDSSVFRYTYVILTPCSADVSDISDVTGSLDDVISK